MTKAIRACGSRPSKVYGTTKTINPEGGQMVENWTSDNLKSLDIIIKDVKDNSSDILSFSDTSLFTWVGDRSHPQIYRIRKFGELPTLVGERCLLPIFIHENSTDHAL